MDLKYLLYDDSCAKRWDNTAMMSKCHTQDGEIIQDGAPEIHF